MNELLAFLQGHGSCRRFTGEELSAEEEREIVRTAQRSPTSSNLQAYSIIGVRDQGKKERLAELCGNQKHIAEASVFMVFCADLYRLKQLNEARGYAFHGGDTEIFIVATVDAALAGGRALMAAQAIGFGGVMVGVIRNNPKEVCALLKLPELVYPVMGMSLGKPVSAPVVKARLPLEAVYMREAYDDSRLAELIAEYDETIERAGTLRGREVEKEKYAGFAGRYTWSEHTARRMGSESPGVRRAHMLGFLQRRGWMKR